ncbi:MAG: DUF4124 domain-containing protein [Nevskia sp.]|nr:DUF4124 domain-containing protein [Nevskia sp.]
MRGIFIVTVALFAASARAEIYRCEQNGQLTYTDRPCAHGAAPAQLPPINTVPAQPAPDASALARQYDRDTARETAARKKARAQAAEAYAVKKAQQEAVRQALIEGRVVKGMTPDQVRTVLNEPTRIENPGSARERWIYVNGRSRRTISFRDGVVAADSDGHARR